MLRTLLRLLAFMSAVPYAWGAPDAPEAIAQIEAALAGGRYDEVERLAGHEGKTPRSQVEALWGAALRLRGRYVEARRLLEQTVHRDPRALLARLQLGLVYRATGERSAERAVWERFYDDYDAGQIDKRNAGELLFVALAARYYGGWQDSNDLFRDTVNADPHGPVAARANIEWAQLFLEKYDAGHAEQCLGEALKILPDDADAHWLMARVKLEQGYDVQAAEREITTALKKNPHHAGALALKAELDLDNEQYTRALGVCQEILRTNPEDARAHELVAAMRWLREDRRGFTVERDRVLATNPHASGFFTGVAELLVKAHRYPDATELEEEALKRDPKDYVALAALGNDYLRLGDEARGLDALKRAWDGDPFNVRTFNLLNLFEKVIPGGYTLVDGKPIRFRVATKDRAVTLRYLTPMLAHEWTELVSRYGFTPKGPVTMELFAEPDHYAVRTVGLPGLDALGVTFGHVITSMSPSLGKFNWGMTLWHEVGHVFSLQLSKYHVPRWFTEGLSEYETARARPEWTRRTHAELYRALEEGRLLSVADLNSGFVRARDIAHMVVAYHQAAETVSFLIRRYGFAASVRALKLYADGKETSEVIPAVTGVDVQAFDAAFRADLSSRLAAYRGTFFVRNSDFSDVDALKERLATHPDDARAQGLYALALVAAHRVDEAQKIVDKEFKRGDFQRTRELVLAAGQVALARKDWANAKVFLSVLTQNGGDGYDARLGLGRVAVHVGDVAEAEKQLNLAKKMDPDRAEPYVELGKLYLKTREEDGLRELEAAARLDCMDPSIPKLLIEKHAAKQRFAKVVELAPLALYTDPFDVALHVRLARAYLELKRENEARNEIDAGLECAPSDAEQAELSTLARRLGGI